MPAVITHYLLSKACAGLMDDSGAAERLNLHGGVYYLGAQGPDILFFALGSKTLNQLGGRIHREGINLFFAECIKRLRMTAAEEERNELAAYMAGFLCHYALDTCAHPYIYYKTGFSHENGRLTGKPVIRHHFLETTIDCILSEKLEDKNPYLLNIAEKISVDAKKRALIGNFLSETVNASYKVFMYPEDYAKAMKDTVLFYKIFRDKAGRKRAAAKAAGKVSRNIDAVAELIHYEPVKPYDYLNEQRGGWHYPWNNSIELNFSFMDLFNKAAEDGRIYINAFEKAVHRQLDDRAALSVLGNKNFSTGLESPVKFLYYNTEFPKL